MSFRIYYVLYFSHTFLPPVLYLSRKLDQKKLDREEGKKGGRSKN